MMSSTFSCSAASGNTVQVSTVDAEVQLRFSSPSFTFDDDAWNSGLAAVTLPPESAESLAAAVRDSQELTLGLDCFGDVSTVMYHGFGLAVRLDTVEGGFECVLATGDSDTQFADAVDRCATEACAIAM